METKTIAKRAFDHYVAINELAAMVALGQGRIVCTGDLTELQINEARIEKRMYVAPDGIGYVLLPWSLSTAKDRKREECIHGL
jgi:hypothetical protein